MRKLILASTSKYRRELLGRLGLPFEATAPGVDETPLPGEPPRDRARRLPTAKARSLRAADAVVIGSDQVASLGGEILRKPGGAAAALRQLQAAQGATVLFHTAVTVLDTAAAKEWSHVDVTEVRFARLPTAALERYLEIDEPF